MVQSPGLTFAEGKVEYHYWQPAGSCQSRDTTCPAIPIDNPEGCPHTRRRAVKSKQLIVFDMDGVIADVSRSYRDTVRKTARLFFRPAPRWPELPSPLFPLSDLARLKQSGNLNNDWDLSCRVIELLMTQIDSPPSCAEDQLADPRDLWERFRDAIRRCDLEPLIRHLRGSSSPLSDLLLTEGRRENRR